MSPEPGWGLVMPFMVCATQSGPYDDDAFVAGYACGMLDESLSRRPMSYSGPYRTASMPQVDLIAMRHGYITKIEDQDEEWTTVLFRPVVATEDNHD